MVRHPGLSIAIVTGADIPQVDALRAQATMRDDVAWVCARPPTTRDQYAPLTQDLLATMGVVGLGTPRATGDRHPVRVMAHLRTSPVRHVVVAEAQWLTEEVHSDISQALLICGVHLTLLASPPVAPGWLAWAQEHAGTITPLAEVAQGLPAPTSECSLGAEALATLERWSDVPKGCPLHTESADCVVAATRRALSSGRLVAAQARAPIGRLAAAEDGTRDEWWGLRSAGLDLYTPSVDALRDASFTEAAPGIHDVARDGSRVGASVVPEYARRALVRQRAAVTWSNGWPTWGLETLFDQAPGAAGR